MGEHHSCKKVPRLDLIRPLRTIRTIWQTLFFDGRPECRSANYPHDEQCAQSDDHERMVFLADVVEVDFQDGLRESQYDGGSKCRESQVKPLNPIDIQTG